MSPINQSLTLQSLDVEEAAKHLKHRHNAALTLSGTNRSSAFSSISDRISLVESSKGESVSLSTLREEVEKGENAAPISTKYDDDVAQWFRNQIEAKEITQADLNAVNSKAQRPKEVLLKWYNTCAAHGCGIKALFKARRWHHIFDAVLRTENGALERL